MAFKCPSPLPACGERSRAPGSALALSGCERVRGTLASGWGALDRLGLAESPLTRRLRGVYHRAALRADPLAPSPTSPRKRGEVHKLPTQLRDLAADTREVLRERRAPENSEGAGNAGRLMRPQPRVRNKIKHTSVVTTVTPEIARHSPRNGFNGLLRALPGDRACLSPSLPDMARQNPVGFAHLRKLDAGVEASEPHDFAVRSTPLSQRLRRAKRRSSACHSFAHGPYRPALPSPGIA
jgi:hypothetical protein